MLFINYHHKQEHIDYHYYYKKGYNFYHYYCIPIILIIIIIILSYSDWLFCILLCFSVCLIGLMFFFIIRLSKIPIFKIIIIIKSRSFITLSSYLMPFFIFHFSLPLSLIYLLKYVITS